MLIQTLDALKDPISEYVHPYLLLQTVRELHERYDVNRWFVYERSCLLNAYVTRMDPDAVALKNLNPAQWNAAFERFFAHLLSRPDIDPDLSAAALQYPQEHIIRPLEQALRGGQYRAALILMSRRANVHLVNLAGAKFLPGASLAFACLALAGYAFPAIQDFATWITVEEEERDFFETFLTWLQEHRTATNCLTHLCLSKLTDLQAAHPEERISQLLLHLVWPPSVARVIEGKRKSETPVLYEIGSRKVLKKVRVEAFRIGHAWASTTVT